MPSFYFPLLFLTPDFEGEMIGSQEIVIARRRWETSTFDLATLATRHDLHFPYQLMDVLLQQCNLELRVSGCADYEAACRVFSAVRIGLYAAGMSPFLSPFVATHSINDYSGINARNSESLRHRLPEGMRSGFDSDAGKISVWPWELSFQCVIVPHKLNATALRLNNGIRIGDEWLRVVNRFPQLRVVEDAVNDAPKLGNMDRSLLHIWSAFEALFPNVSQEVSFRLAIYLAQLIGAPDERLTVYDSAKKAYNTRSKVVHGSKRGISQDEWFEAWQLLMFAVSAIVRRGEMPEEAELLKELLLG